jgi:hypothetical protein
VGVSQRLERKVRGDFPGDSADVVLLRLDSLRLALAEKQSLERIQAAVVLLAGGDLEKLEWAATRAELDWRDVLVWSGLGSSWKARLDEELGHAQAAS